MEKKKIIIGTAALVGFVALFAAIYFIFIPKPAAGAKTVNLTIVHGDGTTKAVELNTDAQYLGEAFAEEEGLVEGEAGPYGLYITAVDGETASDTEKTWWCITKDGQETTTGADQIVIADGEQYELTLLTY